MAHEPEAKKSSAMRGVDTVLVVGGVIAAVLVGLWVFHAIFGLVLWFFKIAILAIVVLVIVRLFTRSRR